MQMLLLSVQVLDGQTSQLASLQDEPCRSVPRRRTRSQGTQRRTSPPRPGCRSCCSRYTGWTHRSRSSRRCKMSTAGQCPRRRTRSQGTQRRSSRHVQDAGAAAVGAGGGRADVAARVAAGRALEVSVHDAVLGRRAREDVRPRRVQDVGAAAVDARVGRTGVAARVAAR